jgi:hypothetical protein
VNALGDGKQTSFSLRQGTKEEKDLLDKVLVVSLLPWDYVFSCLGVTHSCPSHTHGILSAVSSRILACCRCILACLRRDRCARTHVLLSHLAGGSLERDDSGQGSPAAWSPEATRGSALSTSFQGSPFHLLNT